MIRSLMNMINDLLSKCGLPAQRVCSAVNVSRSSWHRWRTRTGAGIPLVKHPGPRKMQTADITAIYRDVAKLDHGTKRTEGVTALYAQYQESLSRRDIAAMVSDARKEANRERRSANRRIYWHGSGIAWAIDDTEYQHRNFNGTPVIINHIEDLGSKYNLEPISGTCLAHGEEIAGHLAHLFGRLGAPLFFKRDGGGNLNHSAVNDVLAEFVVLPLNSPPVYPPFNGAIEKAQGELKTELERQLASVNIHDASLAEPFVRAAANELNHKPKECLKGKVPCQVFFGDRVSFSKQQRKEIYDWIKSRQNIILCGKDDVVSVEAAWRHAAEVWLIKNRFITVAINNKLLPDFYKTLSHYL